MKTFRLFGVLLMAVMLSINLTSCGDDDDDNNPSNYSELIVGTWQLTKWEMWDEVAGEMDYDSGNGKDVGISSVVIQSTGLGYVLMEDGSQEHFGWELNDNKIIFDEEFDLVDSNIYYIEKLTSNELIMKSSRLSTDKEGFIYTLTKVK